MVKTRLSLHNILIEQTGVEHCYYSPPSNLRMQYPCIIYELSGESNIFADDLPYVETRQWTVTVVDSDPDSEIPAKLKALRFCRFDRGFASDNLNHFVFTLFY